MKIRLPERLIPQLHAALPPDADIGTFKVQLGHDGVVYGVGIDRGGVIRRVGEQAVFGASDIHFSPTDITHLECYRS